MTTDELVSRHTPTPGGHRTIAAVVASSVLDMERRLEATERVVEAARGVAGALHGVLSQGSAAGMVYDDPAHNALREAAGPLLRSLDELGGTE